MIDAHPAAAVRAAEEPLLARERTFHGGLMHHAATALATAVRAELRERTGGVVGRSVVGLVGPGSNGGDALHALAALRRAGVDVLAVLTARPHDGGLAALRGAGGRTVAVDDAAPGPHVWLGDAVAAAFAADVVLDGLLGIGARGALRGSAARLVEVLAPLLDQAPSRPVVVAVDLPSGIGVDDGTVPGSVLAADRTLTFGVAKPGLLVPPAAHLAGRVDVVDLGLRPVLAEQGARPVVRRLEGDDVAHLWPVPTAHAHKYARGVVGVVAGTTAYPGAAVLTVAGAQGAGCGMVRYAGPPDVARLVLGAHPEVVVGDVAQRAQAWVVGPGVAPDDDAQRARVAQVLARHAAADAPDPLPVVVDAGALDLLPEQVSDRVVLTPHAGELARLLAARGVAVDRASVEAEPLRWAREARARTGATVLLKGAVTLVVGARTYAQADAPSWLATAGAGDVLAGVAGALLAGAHADGAPADLLAAAAALVHGRAAERACPGGPVVAADVARALPAVVADLLRGVP